jgi:hypothetical protein
MKPSSATANFLLTLLVLAGATGHARAFSDRERFAAPSGAGGGGGRFFTGSPVDGYGCNVCHQGGAEPQVEIRGLPEDGFAPGRLYDIDVVWQQLPDHPVGLQLEFIGRDGRAAGQLQLIPEGQLDLGQRCTSGNHEAGDYEQDAAGRKVLGMAACGATHMRFRYGPPDTPDVSFAMSVVTSDKMGSPEGDGTLNIRRVLRRQGEPAPSSGSCALVVSGQPGARWAWLAFGLALLLRRTRRRAR